MLDSPLIANIASAKVLGDGNHLIKTNLQTSRASPHQSTISGSHLAPNNFLKDPTYEFDEDILQQKVKFENQLDKKNKAMRNRAQSKTERK